MTLYCMHILSVIRLCLYFNTVTYSRFEEEFTVRDILGQGGFGVVFHVKSNFDHGDYALKLIRLPAK